MKVITTTKARKDLAKLVNSVVYTNRPIAIGRRDKAEALIIKFPQETNMSLEETTNMSQYGGAFDFLEDEPDLYSVGDLKKSYV